MVDDCAIALDFCERVFKEYSLKGQKSICAGLIESQLNAQQRGPFHVAIGKSFLHQVHTVADYLIDFFRERSLQRRVVSVYFEMNGFAYNTDLWFCNAFAYDCYEGDIEKYLWLGDYTFGPDGKDLPLTGMEDVQKAFEMNRGPSTPGEILATYLVIARFNELIASAHQCAKQIDSRLSSVIVISNAHDEPDWANAESR